MDAKQLQQFIEENEIEYNSTRGKIWIFIEFYNLKDWSKLIESMFDDDGLECTMKDGYMVFDAIYICEFYGIVPMNVFKKIN